MRGYSLDFVCMKRRLVVEVDGGGHDLRAEHDRVRDAVLARDGFKTLRVAARDLKDELAEIMEWIVRELEGRDSSGAAPTRSPLATPLP